MLNASPVLDRPFSSPGPAGTLRTASSLDCGTSATIFVLTAYPQGYTDPDGRGDVIAEDAHGNPETEFSNVKVQRLINVQDMSRHARMYLPGMGGRFPVYYDRNSAMI
jgi:hypothetical protein